MKEETRTIKDVFDSMSEDQKKAVYTIMTKYINSLEDGMSGIEKTILASHKDVLDSMSKGQKKVIYIMMTEYKNSLER